MTQAWKGDAEGGRLIFVLGFKGGPLKLCISKCDFSGPSPPVLYDQSLRVIPVCNADLKFSCIVYVLTVCFFMQLVAGKNKHLSFFGILISYQILFVFVSCIDKALSYVQ